MNLAQLIYITLLGKKPLKKVADAVLLKLHLRLGPPANLCLRTAASRLKMRVERYSAMQRLPKFTKGPVKLSA